MVKSGMIVLTGREKADADGTIVGERKREN
jgi:hypothetical protein